MRSLFLVFALCAIIFGVLPSQSEARGSPKAALSIVLWRLWSPGVQVILMRIAGDYAKCPDAEPANQQAQRARCVSCV
jgi:hypothetical protein